jgi:hypothetical protein
MQARIKHVKVHICIYCHAMVLGVIHIMLTKIKSWHGIGCYIHYVDKNQIIRKIVVLNLRFVIEVKVDC